MLDNPGDTQAGELLRRHPDALGESLAGIKTLRAIIPICAQCKKIRDEEGCWQQVDISTQTLPDAVFSHGFCPACIEDLYGSLLKSSSG